MDNVTLGTSNVYLRERRAMRRAISKSAPIGYSCVTAVTCVGDSREGEPYCYSYWTASGLFYTVVYYLQMY